MWTRRDWRVVFVYAIKVNGSPVLLWYGPHYTAFCSQLADGWQSCVSKPWHALLPPRDLTSAAPSLHRGCLLISWRIRQRQSRSRMKLGSTLWWWIADTATCVRASHLSHAKSRCSQPKPTCTATLYALIKLLRLLPRDGAAVLSWSRRWKERMGSRYRLASFASYGLSPFISLSLTLALSWSTFNHHYSWLCFERRWYHRPPVYRHSSALADGRAGGLTG